MSTIGSVPAPGEAAGDVRYDASITGYCRRRRGRLRETQRHINLLVTSIARDNGSAAVELQDQALVDAMRKLGATIRAHRAYEVDAADAREAINHIAALCILWAEAIDVPPDLRGPRLMRLSPARVLGEQQSLAA